MTAFLLAMLILAPLPWIALYRLDRRCALARETGDLDTKGKGTEPAAIPSLASADRRSSERRATRAQSDQPEACGPM